MSASFNYIKENVSGTYIPAILPNSSHIDQKEALVNSGNIFELVECIYDESRNAFVLYVNIEGQEHEWKVFF